jgi:hypothetical protein
LPKIHTASDSLRIMGDIIAKELASFWLCCITIYFGPVYISKPWYSWNYNSYLTELL